VTGFADLLPHTGREAAAWCGSDHLQGQHPVEGVDVLSGIEPGGSHLTTA
jgi:hypothetical protein